MAAFTNHPNVNLVLMGMLIAGFATATRGIDFAGGTGEPNDPYQIATAEQLIGISSDPNLIDKHFVLVADIDLDPNLPGRMIFHRPVVEWLVGRRGRLSLQGSFGGDGHVIRNCVLVGTTDVSYAGFFGDIPPEAVVRDLCLENMLLVNGSWTASIGNSAGLLAASNRGTVVNCSVSGVLTTNAGGGLLGWNMGLVVGCCANCRIFGSSVGGLVGRNDGSVLLSKSDGVLYSGSLAGGLVDTNHGTIQYCRSDGFISSSQIGGLVGQNEGAIRECCVTATLESGGGIAYSNSGTIVNCYATGHISGTRPDGLVLTNLGAILSSYSTTISQVRPESNQTRRSTRWDIPPGSADADFGTIFVLAQRLVQYVYYLDPNNTEDDTNGPFSDFRGALSQAQMTHASSFVGFDFYGDANDGPEDHWFMPPDGYPVLTWQTEITGLIGVPDVSGLSLEQARMVLKSAGFESDGIRYDYARSAVPEGDTTGQAITTHPVGYLPPGSPVTVVVSLGEYDLGQNLGDGSAERPYRIETPGQLDALYEQSGLWDKHFELTADIDLCGYIYTHSLIGYFTGEFNGAGHTIRNLQCGRGLFSTIEPGASVHDLIIHDAWTHYLNIDTISLIIDPSWQIGVLASENRGRVSRCEVSGRVFGGSSEVGGLVGYNLGQLADCRFTGRVRSSDESQYAGGLAGSNAGSITGCCARDVEVSGGDMVGGLVGQSSSETALIEGCYATGAVRGISSVGGLVGQNGAAAVRRIRSVLVGDPISVAAEPTLGGVVLDSYAACSVVGEQAVGGCIGWAPDSESEQESCFFITPDDGGDTDNGLGTPLTAAQMMQQASFAGWDFETVWTICEDLDYPRLRWENVNCEVGP